MGNTHYWVYILRCDNDSYYTGYTTDMARRYQEHVTGTAKCKYTRSFKPLSIARCWKISGDKATAMKIEIFIKQLSRKRKEQFIQYPEALTELFSCQPFAVSI